jgi:hypothetical protein
MWLLVNVAVVPGQRGEASGTGDLYLRCCRHLSIP